MTDADDETKQFFIFIQIGLCFRRISNGIVNWEIQLSVRDSISIITHFPLWSAAAPNCVQATTNSLVEGVPEFGCDTFFDTNWGEAWECWKVGIKSDECEAFRIFHNDWLSEKHYSKKASEKTKIFFIPLQDEDFIQSKNFNFAFVSHSWAVRFHRLQIGLNWQLKLIKLRCCFVKMDTIETSITPIMLTYLRHRRALTVDCSILAWMAHSEELLTSWKDYDQRSNIKDQPPNQLTWDGSSSLSFDGSVGAQYCDTAYILPALVMIDHRFVTLKSLSLHSPLLSHRQKWRKSKRRILHSDDSNWLRHSMAPSFGKTQTLISKKPN